MARSLRMCALVLCLALPAALGLSGPRAAYLAGLASSSSASLSSSLGPAPRFFTQDQDHFDGTNTNTWQQAYYVNDTFWKPGSDAPVFLCVGGEGPPLDGSVVVSSVHCNGAVEMLEETGALMFAVEHRYYGCHNMSACPVASFPDNATEALRFLSSRQALADLAKFHAYASEHYSLTTANKWVSFGGSYPGMLAGWFRLRFPHLIHASVASSAPVEAIVDMQGYNDYVAKAYAVADNSVGGSPACEDAIRTGHASIGTMFGSAQGRSKLASLFGHTADWYSSRDNQADFAGNGAAYFPAQENDPSCTQPGCDVAHICQIMTNASIGDEVARLAALRKAQQVWLPALRTGGASAGRAPAANGIPDFWGYQTCTEFAFYQTCEVGSRCFFTQGYVLLNTSMAFCTTEFGIPAQKVKDNVAYTNAYYGGRTPAGTCLLYPNGEVDPWASQSILKAPSAGISTMMVDGASHHFWTHPTKATDQPSVIAARKAIRSYVHDMLAADCEQAAQ